MKTKTHVMFSLLLICFLPDVFNGFSGISFSAANDLILLNCGSAEAGIDADNRKWYGDSSSKFLLSSSGSSQEKAEFQDPSLPSEVPYMSARVLTREATYRFPATPGSRYWVRLHFYPSSYGGRNESDSFFSVACDGITLLRNFSAAITAKALTLAYIMREFSLSPIHNSIHLTFAPSDKHNASYAFINGIEVIPIPNVFESPARFVGFANNPIEIGSSTLQTMYRLNVGGQFISPTNDSGLARTWYDDSPYLFGAGIGVTFSEKAQIRYPRTVPKYIAPTDVYNTARSMGPDSNINLNYNLTWVFRVDANFTYVVRFHFCELEMNKINQRVFDIYLNNQTAEQMADVIGWSKFKDVPVYKDYAVYVNDLPDDDELWVALHPSSEAGPEYMDSILNGLEIFKLSDTSGNLAGSNPEPSQMLIAAGSAREDDTSSSKTRSNVIGGAAGGVAACSLVALCIAVYQRQKRGIGSDFNARPSWLPVYGGSNSRSGERKSITSTRSCATASNLSSLAVSLCRHFSFNEIKQGTKNFNESRVIGVGGFGKVYWGVIDGGTKVAIKRANPSSEQGVHEFQTEIEMLSKLRHRHLVSLIGYCDDGEEMILVYDYMAHGTLREHLYKSNNPPLSWNQRLEICVGAARGLHYLHTGAKYTIIHRDVKTTNILVDERWVAKVSDFGLSKTGPSLNQTHVSTVVKGSFGYLDPEYFRRQQLTDKSDVYSFGVVLFEVLCARPVLNPSLPKEQVSLADWALNCHRQGTLQDIIDPFLNGKIKPKCFNKFADTAVKCLADHGIDRPAMGDVLWNLEFALQLQEMLDSSPVEHGGAATGS